MRTFVLWILVPLFVRADFFPFNGSMPFSDVWDAPTSIAVSSSLQCYNLCNLYSAQGCYGWQFQTSTQLCFMNGNYGLRNFTVQFNNSTPNSTYGYGGCGQCSNKAVCRFVGINVTCACLPGYVGDGQIANCSLPSASACAPNASNSSGTCQCSPGYHGDGLASGSGCSNLNASDSYQDQDYRGFDIGLVTAPTAYECQGQCNSFIGCACWSYDPVKQACYIKNAIGHLINNTGIIAGLGGCSLCAPNASCSQVNGSLSCTCLLGFIGDGMSNCTLAPPTSPPTTPAPTTQPPTTQMPTTQLTTQLPTTQQPTTPLPTTQRPTTPPPTTQVATTSVPTTFQTTNAPTTPVLITTAQPTDPPLSCAGTAASCVTTGGVLQTDKRFNATTVVVSGSLVIGSTVVLNNSTMIVDGGLNLSPNGVLNVTSNGMAPAINSASDVTLNGSINVQILRVDTLTYNLDGTYNYTVIASDTGITGQFSNVSVELETSSPSVGCQRNSYTSETSYTAKSLNIVVTCTSTNVCRPAIWWPVWMYGVIGGAVGLIAIVVGVVLWKFKTKKQSKHFVVEY